MSFRKVIQILTIIKPKQ